MDARKVAAQFVAYVWYEEIRDGRLCPNEAARFAEENWSAFLPVAHKGLGKLLVRIASVQIKRRRTKRHSLGLAVAG
jgi:hypothetical protein